MTVSLPGSNINPWTVFAPDVFIELLLDELGHLLPLSITYLFKLPLLCKYKFEPDESIANDFDDWLSEIEQAENEKWLIENY